MLHGQISWQAMPCKQVSTYHQACEPQVVEEYTKLKPSNPLAKYLPALRALEGKGDKFTGLTGFDEAVHKLGSDQGAMPCAQWGANCIA